MYNYNEVKHEYYNSLELRGEESRMAGVMQKDDYEKLKLYKKKLKNYLIISQIGIRANKSNGYSKIMTLEQVRRIKKELTNLDMFLI